MCIFVGIFYSIFPGSYAVAFEHLKFMQNFVKICSYEGHTV